LNEGGVADYLVTGGWSEKAAEEASRLGATVSFVHPVNYNGGIDASKFTFSLDASYIYYCDNETVHGSMI
jgi:phosphoserine aminotransferase